MTSADGAAETPPPAAGDVITFILAALSIAAAAVGLAYRPALLEAAAAALALAAVIPSTRSRGFAAVAVAIAATGWVVGMTIAVLAERPLY